MCSQFYSQKRRQVIRSERNNSKTATIWQIISSTESKHQKQLKYYVKLPDAIPQYILSSQSHPSFSPSAKTKSTIYLLCQKWFPIFHHYYFWNYYTGNFIFYYYYDSIVLSMFYVVLVFTTTFSTSGCHLHRQNFLAPWLVIMIWVSSTLVFMRSIAISVMNYDQLIAFFWRGQWEYDSWLWRNKRSLNFYSCYSKKL